MFFFLFFLCEVRKRKVPPQTCQISRIGRETDTFQCPPTQDSGYLIHFRISSTLYIRCITSQVASMLSSELEDWATPHYIYDVSHHKWPLCCLQSLRLGYSTLYIRCITSQVASMLPSELEIGLFHTIYTMYHITSGLYAVFRARGLGYSTLYIRCITSQVASMLLRLGYSTLYIRCITSQVASMLLRLGYSTLYIRCITSQVASMLSSELEDWAIPHYIYDVSHHKWPLWCFQSSRIGLHVQLSKHYY